MIKLGDLYSTKELSFIRPEGGTLYFNGACHTPIAIQAYEASSSFHELFGVCSGRGAEGISANLNKLVQDTRNLILDQMRLDKKEWEIVFCQNASQGLNIATNIIAHYLKKTEYKFGVAYHPLSHNSLIIPAKKIIKRFYAKELNFNSELKFPSEFDKLHKMILMPYIDNAFGYDHFSYYYSTVENKKYMGSQRPTQHIILDACQAGTTIFNPVKSDLANMACCAAVAFSCHKVHSEHLGVLAIRKKYLQNTDLLEVEGIDLGGGTLAFFDERGIPNIHKDHRGLEAGLLNESAILAFGAWLKFLTTINYNLLTEMKRATVKIKSELTRICPPDIECMHLEQFIKLRMNGFAGNNIILLGSSKFSASEIEARIINQGMQIRAGKFCVDYGFNKFNLQEGIRISLDWSINNDDPYREVERAITTIATVAYDLSQIRLGNTKSMI